jgi:hypothetical protein
MVTNSYTTINTTDPLVALDKAKDQLNIERIFTLQDELITDAIEAAQVACEDYINRGISERKFIMELSVFESTVTFARNYENDVIEKIEYYQPGETTLTLLANDQYKLRKSNIIECFDIKFLSMPATEIRDDAVIITVKQGFTTSNCPKPILQAIKLRIADFYERREDREGGNSAVSNNLLRHYRKF